MSALTLAGGSSEFKFMCAILVTNKVTVSYPEGIIFSQVSISLENSAPTGS